MKSMGHKRRTNRQLETWEMPDLNPAVQWAALNTNEMNSVIKKKAEIVILDFQRKTDVHEFFFPFFSPLVLWLRFLYKHLAAAAAKSLQLCLTLCNPIDGSPPGSSVPGILQARTLEWVAISFSNAWKWKLKVKSLSHAQLIVSPWNEAYQAPPSMGCSRQEYWSGLPLPSLLQTPYNSLDHDLWKS